LEILKREQASHVTAELGLRGPESLPISSR
jgi:hypothetical protein